jgi:membrane-associated HD superfamily phosphohydrolase
LIRLHVSDGVELAQKHQLPKAVIDVIKQHHGTTLIRYFYHRAVEQSRAPFATLTPARKPAEVGSASPVPPRAGDSANPLEALRARPSAPPPPNAPPEQAFRYDGPKPQFKESAIISMADGVEATTRSLRQIGPEQLHELINRIVEERITDGQLDEAPLTLEEITRIKNSFQFTLLNMLHARVAYPKAEETEAAVREAGR